eukprot:GHRR01030137.1.p1 GENE.GHRR01030137.1~~GHRR01030137.1.p1  ORF type:complete len:169 (-),score=42.83 GHRR01030137.1:138-644(-)
MRGPHLMQLYLPPCYGYGAGAALGTTAVHCTLSAPFDCLHCAPISMVLAVLLASLLLLLLLSWPDCYCTLCSADDPTLLLCFCFLVLQAMADFWWQHFVPAKLHLQLHPADETGIKRFEPPKQHPYKGEIQRRSRVMIEHAPKQWFTDAETKRARAAEAATPAALPAP